MVMRFRFTTMSQSGAKEPATPSACNLSVPVEWRRIALPFLIGAILVEFHIECRLRNQGSRTVLIST